MSLINGRLSVCMGNVHGCDMTLWCALSVHHQCASSVHIINVRVAWRCGSKAPQTQVSKWHIGIAP